MSYKKGEEIHIEDDDAMAAQSTGHLRWILAVSLLAALALMSAIWIFGAFSQGDAEEEITMSGTQEFENDPEGEPVVSEDDTLADDAVVTPDDEEVLGTDTTE
ncbi:hypothetical protein [Aurantiacibacter sp. MUD61]|uniref:hypothetical protein n=1 Tax=Aurantiacibacter sp. MUD61 TaxID=3009083 RepID=UPI0022F09747|nr:hypothetical protein [Aurantiacibacter sp. MUD61]